MRQSCQQTWGHRNCTFVLRLFSAYLAPTVWLASTESDNAWVSVSADLEQKQFNIVSKPAPQFWIMFLPLFFLVLRRIFWLTTIPWQRGIFLLLGSVHLLIHSGTEKETRINLQPMGFVRRFCSSMHIAFQLPWQNRLFLGVVALVGVIPLHWPGVVGWAVLCFFAMAEIIGINLSILIKCKKQG